MSVHNEDGPEKVQNLPGINRTLLDLSALASVKVVRTTVVTPMYKKGVYGYISFTDRLDPGDVVKVGVFGLCYRIIEEVRSKKPDKGVVLYKVFRTDGYGLSGHDISGIKKGQTAQIVNRRTFTQIFNQGIKPYLK